MVSIGREVLDEYEVDEKNARENIESFVLKLQNNKIIVWKQKVRLQVIELCILFIIIIPLMMVDAVTIKAAAFLNH